MVRIGIRKLALALTFGATLGACGAMAIATAGTARAETVLKFSAYFPKDNFLYVDVFTPMLREIEEKTNGEIKFEEYPAGALGKMTEQLDLLRNGLADMSMYIPSYSKGRFPMAGAGMLPFAFESSTQGTRVLNALVDDYLAKEQKDVKLLFMFATVPGGFLTNGVAIDSIDKLDGLKMRSAGAAATEMLRLGGANIITVPLPEIYVALERGTVQGTIIDLVTATTYKLHEPATHFSPVRVSTVVAAIGMNKRSFGKLTPEQQKIVMEAATSAAERTAAAYERVALEADAILEKDGVTIVDMSPAELERFRAAVVPLWDKWIVDAKEDGIDGEAFMTDFKKAIEANKAPATN